MPLSEPHISRARFLRTLLAHHGMNQTDLAGILGCSQQSASNKLAGRRRLSADDTLAIADAFGLDPRTVLQPPPLADVFGSVRQRVPDLLTWPKYQAVQVSWVRPFRWVDPERLESEITLSRSSIAA